MADQVDSTRQERADLTRLALDQGVNPLKAAEFGSRVSDALRESRSNLDNKGAGSMLSAVFRNSSGQLSGMAVDIEAGVDVGTALKTGRQVEAKEALGFALGEAEMSSGVKADEIKNYAFTVTPTKGPGGR